ncbi:hypothetical protein D3C76_915230 [compost metagenome]
MFFSNRDFLLEISDFLLESLVLVFQRIQIALQFLILRLHVRDDIVSIVKLLLEGFDLCPLLFNLHTLIGDDVIRLDQGEDHGDQGYRQ